LSVALWTAGAPRKILLDGLVLFASSMNSVAALSAFPGCFTADHFRFSSRSCAYSSIWAAGRQFALNMPGITAVTRMPNGATSSASASNNAVSPAFEAE
jgi:hypothetical protein